MYKIKVKDITDHNHTDINYPKLEFTVWHDIHIISKFVLETGTEYWLQLAYKTEVSDNSWYEVNFNPPTGRTEIIKTNDGKTTTFIIGKFKDSSAGTVCLYLPNSACYEAFKTAHQFTIEHRKKYSKYGLFDFH